MRIGFTACAAAADGVGELLFYVEKSGFHSESRLMYCSKMYSISFAAERLFFSASALICSSSSVLIRIVKRVFSSWKRKERLRPTFLFLLGEKKKRAAPGTKKKRTWSGLRCESCFFFVRALRPDGSGLVLCGLALPLAPLPLTGAEKLVFLLRKEFSI